MLSGQWFGLCFYDGIDAGGTATTECPPNRGSEWKHESPDFSRGENQVKPSDAIHLATMDKLGITSIVSEDEELDAVKGIKRVWLDTTGQSVTEMGQEGP